MLSKIVEAIAMIAFILGGVSLGPNATHPAFAFVAIYVILYAGLFGPKHINEQHSSATQALLFGYFIGLPLMAAQWLLTH